MPDDECIDKFVAQVQESAKYAQLDSNLVRQIAVEELRNQKDQRKALKSTRTRLHRLAGAFLAQKIDYAKWLDIFRSLPRDDSEAFNETSLRMMKLHASTQERLPFLDTFYQTCLAPIAPVSSVLDLACGLNPLAMPWMPLQKACIYNACDVVVPLVEFLNDYFQLRGATGNAITCNLLQSIPQQKVQVAFLLKLLPILDQVDPNASINLLDQVKADHLLISYPSRSLGGRSKGMKQTYVEHFERITSGRNFEIQSFDFPNETVYLLSR
jgi:16S rRNA (guanine(1405)-N(7))-methyltransferase